MLLLLGLKSRTEKAGKALLISSLKSFSVPRFCLTGEVRNLARDLSTMVNFQILVMF